MKPVAFLLLALLTSIICCSPKTSTPKTSSIKDNQRVVSIGGAVTEAIYELGAQSHLVGIDTTSTYPQTTSTIAKVGYQRTLSAESIASLKPDIIIATTDAGPPNAIAQLQAIGIEIVILDATPTVEIAKNRIKKLATLFNKEQTGELIISRLDNQLRQAVSYTQKQQTKPKVLFLYSRAQASAMVSGRNTSADEMIRLSGGQNVITGYEGYKPITAEAVVAAAPEVILLPENSLKSIGGIDQLLKLPGINQTPAGQNRKIITMEDLKLLGFTPRLGDAVCELAKLLHQQDAIVEVEAKR